MGPTQAKLKRILENFDGSARFDAIIPLMSRGANRPRTRLDIIAIARRANRLHGPTFRWNELGMTIV